MTKIIWLFVILCLFVGVSYCKSKVSKTNEVRKPIGPRQPVAQRPLPNPPPIKPKVSKPAPRPRPRPTIKGGQEEEGFHGIHNQIRPPTKEEEEEGSEGLAVDNFKPMPYKFEYKAPNHKSFVERMEEADAEGTVRGFYTIEMGNGLYRYVDYVADKNGFRAAIRSNEPGLGMGALGSPSDTTFELEKPPENLKDIDLPERTDTDTAAVTRRTGARDVRHPSTLIEERRRTRTETRRGITGVRLRPISEEERERLESVTVEDEIIEEPVRTIVEEIREPRRVLIEERRTERREPRRVITTS